MKTFLFSFFLCAPLLAAAQTVDSAAIRQVDSLLRIARIAADKFELDDALKITTDAEKLALSETGGLGAVSAAYGGCCHIRGLIASRKGNYAEAEKWYLKAISIREKALSKEHADYGKSLNGLAVLYMNMGRYEKAGPLFLEAKAIQKKVLGKEHPSYAGSLINLAFFYSEMGQYEKAEPLLLEAKDIWEKVLGKEHSDYAMSLNGLALLYMNMGQYEKAEPLYLEAKTIREKVLGKDHPDYASSLNNLAILYRGMGQYQKAETLHLEAKAIREKVLGKDHRDYASSLNNLGVLYQSMGQYEKAEPLFLEANAIREKVLGKEHSDYCGSLINLANLFIAMGQYEKAEPLCLEAKEIFEVRLKNRLHGFYIRCLNILAYLYVNIGQYEKAEALYLEAKAIQEKALGKEHPEYAWSLNTLAVLYENIGQYEKAETLFLELSIVDRALTGKSVCHLSERELNNYLNTFSARHDQTLSFAQMAESQKLAPACYDNSLFYKGFLLHAVNRVRQLALADTAATEKLNRLKGLERRMAGLYSQPIAERDSALVAQLETQANDLEKDLARTVTGYGDAMRQVQWQEVQAALKPGEAAIEFVHYRYDSKKETDSIMYAALIVRPGPEASGAPQFIPLFEEHALTTLLQQVKAKQTDHLNALYQTPTLYTLLWQPLEQALAGVQTVYFSPDGLLHRINLRAIATPEGQILSDRYRLIRLNSTRQLVIQPTTQVLANDALVYGGIQYDMDATAIQKANVSLPQPGPGSTRGDLGFHQTDSTQRTDYRNLDETGGGGWKYLPFTEVEAELLRHDLQEAGTSVRLLSGYAATEESFKAMGRPSPRILHLATHGFFFPDPKRTADGDAPVFKLSEHPMIRSGLLLAGANQAWSRGLGRKPAQPGLEDGILTAYEISQMDLSNTELAVLSACETALGDIAGNEGVYGLQRAFKIAGARYLLMSLWQVSDLETQQFMTAFYRHWLKDGQPVPDAYRATQQEMREKYKDPFLWAGFVLVE